MKISLAAKQFHRKKEDIELKNVTKTRNVPKLRRHVAMFCAVIVYRSKTCDYKSYAGPFRRAIL